MLGVSHAATGLLAGVAVGALLGAHPVDVVSCAAVGAGAALLPDLDEPGSTVGRSLGFASRGVSRALRAASRRVYRATATPYDLRGRSDGGHRHLTHTIPAVLVFGAVAGVLAVLHVLAGWAVVVLLSALGFSPIAKAFRGKHERRFAFSLVWFGATSLGVAVVVLGFAPWLLGVTVGVGALVHVLGDWLTRSGVPLAWPLTYRGKRWWMFRSPVAFHTGKSRVEDGIRVGSLIVAPIMMVMGAPPLPPV
ncbi:metal-dependent hydrolase [Nocardiopsis dassonvillei]|uniref:metal-dependent hydrolase n=1 Tax=Nocardiopsis dassonvillei TaxID=2014 RepID=UPI00157BC3FC|nr:metal-dependent hydrolase [Nocardiopsis dassonvillei]